MSVPRGARGENLTTVFTLASDLLALLIHAVMNNHCFPHKYTRELGEPAVAVARDIMHHVYMTGCTYDRDRRDSHVASALAAMDCLQAEIHLNFMHFTLKAPKACEISDILTELRTKFISFSKTLK